MTNKTKIILLYPLRVITLSIAILLGAVWTPLAFSILLFIYLELEYKGRLACPKCGEKIYTGKVTNSIPRFCASCKFPTNKQYEVNNS